jgi:hypothetical protein
LVIARIHHFFALGKGQRGWKHWEMSVD